MADFLRCSSFTYHLAVAARCGSESRGAADFYTGAQEYVGADYKVRGHLPFVLWGG